MRGAAVTVVVIAARWAPDEVEQLLDGYESGESVGSIAKRLGRTPSAVHNQLHRLRREAGAGGVPTGRRRWTTADEDRLIALRVAGSSYKSIGAQLDRSASACRHRVRTLALGGRADAAALIARQRRASAPWTDAADAELLRRYSDEETLAVIAEATGYSLSAVYDRLRALGRSGARVELRRPRWTEERRARLVRRRSEGASLRQLEREFGITRGTLTSQLRTLRRGGYDV